MTAPEHVLRNREAWNRSSEAYFEPGRRAWASAEPEWGIWGIPERELGILPDVVGKDVLELGCGTAYWSAWLARLGARAVGLDVSPRQLASARALQAEFELEFPLVEASAEEVPLADGSFDLVLSEYGASLWCDPYRWVPEAARLLRPGGELVFLTNHTLLMLCSPDEGVAGEQLLRDYFGLYRLEWPDDESIEFHLPYGEWIRLFRTCGLAVEALLELRAPAGGDPGRWDHITLEWARRWPSEEIWKLSKEA